MRTHKLCRACSVTKPVAEFRSHRGKLKAPCRICENARSNARSKWFRSNDSEWSARESRQGQARRGRNPAREFCKNARKSDKKRGHQYNLTVELVTELFEKPCSYCGDTALKRTLDRIDNSTGHVPSNVLPCCIRCNFVRRDMPKEAWDVLAPAMRQARESGKFGGWTCAIHHRVDPLSARIGSAL